MGDDANFPLTELATVDDRDRLEIFWLAWREREEFRNEAQVAGKFCSKALALGDLLLAREILNSHSRNIDARHALAHLKARILVQSGNTEAARALLHGVMNERSPTCDGLCLLARTYKDDWLRCGGSWNLEMAIEQYSQAYHRFVDLEPGVAAFPSVNAASLSLLAGRREEAFEWARRTLGLEDASRADSRQAPWVEPMLGEARLVLGESEVARRHYEKCLSMALRDRAAARKQARLVLECLGQAPDGLDGCFALPTVVVFSGHMVDAPGRVRPRFPAEMESDVAAAIEARLREIGAGIGYSSAAVGSDLLFAEAMHRLGGEFHIYLSGPSEDFRRRSVDFAGGGWPARFATLIAASRNKVDSAPDHQPSDASLGYAYCNLKLCGIAGMRAGELNLDLVPLAVYDGGIGDGAGGTADFVEFWRGFKKNHEGFFSAGRIQVIPQVIDTREILKRRLPEITLSTPDSAAGTRASGGARVKIQSMQQDLKALLFADVKGFSKLAEANLPAFFKRYMTVLSRMINEAAAPPVVTETWGDAIYMVFDEVEHAGRFALKMRREMSPPPNGNLDVHALGLEQPLDIRIALHAGPVFHLVDPITRRISFTGRHVSQTARLEPVTEPGEVFCTEAFAALSWAYQASGYSCEFIGTKQLAKDYGNLRVFRLCDSSGEAP